MKTKPNAPVCRTMLAFDGKDKGLACVSEGNLKAIGDLLEACRVK